MFLAVFGLAFLHLLHPHGTALGQPAVCQCRASSFHFEVCNGFANQRISFVLGAILALEHQDLLRLPHFLLEGAVGTSGTLLTSPMGHFYNVSLVQAELLRHGIRSVVQVGGQHPVQGEPFSILCDDVPMCHSTVEIAFSHVMVGCPFGEWLVNGQQVASHTALVQGVLRSLQPSDAMEALIQQVLRHIQHYTDSGRFSFVHVRLEGDWIQHCRSWTTATRDNCLSNTWYLPEQLRAKGFSPKVPLYLTSHWPLVSPSERRLLLSQLRRAGFRVIPPLRSPTVSALHREEAALLNYFVGMHAARMLGNSVSTFSALMMLERRLLGLPAAQYNGGNIPLSGLLPLYSLPWVFTVADPTDVPFVKAAVRSALAVGGLLPHCLYHTALPPALADWLKDRGVRLLLHSPQWEPWLPALYPGSPVYRLVSLFLRIDVPLLEELRQFDYVLTTGPRVFFRKRLTLDSFPNPLPKGVGVVNGVEGLGEVVLVALDGLRNEHSRLLDFLRRGPPSCASPGWVRPDYCALTTFFTDSVPRWALPRRFDATWFAPFDNASAIVTLHVPRSLTPACRDPVRCPAVSCDAACQYVTEWVQHSRGRAPQASRGVAPSVDTTPWGSAAHAEGNLPGGLRRLLAFCQCPGRPH